MADGDPLQLGVVFVADGCHLKSFRTKYEAVCRHQQGGDRRREFQMNFRVRTCEEGAGRIIHQATRTLLVEILVDNPTGTLFTGAYAEVHLKLPTAVSSLLVPANSLIFRSEGLQVATVRDEHHAELKRITVGHDFGTEVEVVGGLTGNEAVIVNPPDSLVSGQTVRISQTSSPEEQQQQKGLEK